MFGIQPKYNPNNRQFNKNIPITLKVLIYPSKQEKNVIWIFLADFGNMNIENPR